MTVRASHIPCTPMKQFMQHDVHGGRQDAVMLTVNCENYLTNTNTCRGACAAGHRASVEVCESCTDYIPTQAPSLASRAANLGRSMMSAIVAQHATAEQQAVRLATCRACAHLKPAENPDDVGWCGACGCPQNALSLLRVKAKILHPSCPKGYWKLLSQETITTEQVRDIKPLSE